MNILRTIDLEPADMMHRRTVLPLRGHFSWGGTTVAISTNAYIILHAAADAGLVPQRYTNRRADLYWEIVAEPGDDASPDNLSCNVLRTYPSVYLSLGTRQWFAFDEETAEGIGFVTVNDPNLHSDAGVTAYLLAVIDAVRESLEKEPERYRLT